MPETISSRTPEGEPNVCPVCEGAISIEPSSPSGDAPCPQCGTLLWFVNTENGVRLYETELLKELRDRLIEVVGDKPGLTPGEAFELATTIAHIIGRFSVFDLDSLDMVELVMELEENEFGVKLSSDQLQDVAEIMEWFARRTRRKR
jgi:acyl carrier protein